MPDEGAPKLLTSKLPYLASLLAQSQGEPEIVVAILDGPVNLSHECFQGANLKQLDSSASGLAISGPALRHGTHVASLIFGQRTDSVLGIAPLDPWLWHQ